MEYYIYLIKIGKWTSERILLGKKKIELRLTLKNRLKNLIFNFYHVLYLLNSLCNLFSLSFFNNCYIYYNNKNEIFYKIHI